MPPILFLFLLSASSDKQMEWFLVNDKFLLKKVSLNQLKSPRRVDFPEPDGPTTAKEEAASNFKFILVKYDNFLIVKNYLFRQISCFYNHQMNILEKYGLKIIFFIIFNYFLILSLRKQRRF